LDSIRRAVAGKTTEAAGALDMIKRRFFNDIIFPRIVVRGIRSVLAAVGLYVRS
jgi:hypothetical protein